MPATVEAPAAAVAASPSAPELVVAPGLIAALEEAELITATPVPAPEPELAPVEIAETAPVVVEAPVAPEPASAPAAEEATAVPAANISEQFTSRAAIMEVMGTIAAMTKVLGEGKGIVEGGVGNFLLVAYGEEKANAFPEGEVAQVTDIYNAFRDASKEPEARTQTLVYEGGALDKMNIIKESFTQAQGGTTVFLRSDKVMFMIGKNVEHMQFVKTFE